MKFPLSELDRQKYFETIYKLLDDDECYIYIDTNIIALLYRIYDSARKEFFDWIAILIQKNRVKTPLWALNEYTNRFINNQLEDYLTPLKKINTINKDYLEVSNFLKMNIDTASLGGTSYSSLKDFEDDLKLIEVKLKTIAAAAKSKDEKYKLKIHDEVQIHFEKTVLNSDLNNILTKINNHGSVRYHHRLPPGFQDGQKDLNSYGDLIIWQEILDSCGKDGIKKAILITNDAKKDWVYAPNKIVENGKIIPNLGKLKIADPRLVYEFKLVTNSEEFYIINFDLLTQVLIQNVKGTFVQLAKALQIAHQQDSQDENVLESDNSETLHTIDQNLQNIEPTIAQNNKVQNHEYSSYALADAEFPLHEDTLASELILQLKSYNWYVQNPALESFLESNINSIDQNQTSTDKLFVIGRNIYQAACGASAVAVDFMNSLDYHFLKFNEYVSKHLFAGMLYEIYFDSNNEFRSELKSNFITQVLSVKQKEFTKSSLAFINEKLETYKEYLLYLPGSLEKVNLKIELDEEVSSTEDWLGGVTNFRDLEVLEANGKSLLTEDISHSLDIYYSSMSVDALIDLVCNSYAIPKQQIEILDQKILEENALVNFYTMRLKKLYYPGIF